MKYIYLIYSENGFYKIGITKNLTKRLKTLQTGNAECLHLVDSFKSDYASTIEAALHRKYKQYRVNGEWFNIKIDLKAECLQYENNLNYIKENNTYDINRKYNR